MKRRHFLRGAGVALALPWLESLAPRRARGAPGPAPRFVAIYFPMGTAPFWHPPALNGALELSPILAPLATYKSRLTVLSNVANTAYGATTPAPSFGQETGSFLTCVPGQGTQSGKSVDQVIADGLGVRSLQLGLSNTVSPDASQEGIFQRSVSWRGPTEPLYKMVSPQSAFDRIVSAAIVPPADPAAAARRATRKSVLDFVLDDAAAVQKRLGRSDRARLDKFQSTVRALEKRVEEAGLPPACTIRERPTLAILPGDLPPDYDRNRHADLMIDLMIMALSCNTDRVVSFMLDDGGSDFTYDFLQERAFTDTGSTAGTAPVGSFRALATSPTGLDGHATINYWFASKVASLCRRLASLADGPNGTVLDNTVIWFGSGMHDGQSRSPAALPLAYLGGAAGALKVNQHLDLQGKRSLADVYVTMIQKVFGIDGVPTFGDSKSLAFEILA